MHVISGILLSLLQLSNAVLVSDFYPFGDETTDSRLSPNDDDSSRIQLSATIPFFGTGHNSIFVNNNGLLSFGKAVSMYTPRSFPLGDDHQLIAPYWADVDTREAGTVWFREVNDSALLNRIGRDIHANTDTILSFQPTSALVVTWDRVGYYSAHYDLTNTFQCVLLSDGSLSFAIFLYADGGVQWTTGDNSGGAGGRGGTPAVVGVNAGDGIQSATVPGSKTQEIINIATTTNVKLPGMWVFKVNEDISEDTDVCLNEEVYSKGIIYNWPATLSGSSVTITCPNNPAYLVNRECSMGERWQDFDQEACGVLTEELNNLLLTPLSSETLGDFVAKFSEIVALSTNSVVDQNKENLKLIARIFEKVVDFIIQFDVMIGESEIITKIVETVNSLFQWTPSVIEAASSSRIMRAFEQVASFYAWQIPENASQIINLTSTVLVTERMNLEELQRGGRTFRSGGDELTHSSEDEVNDTSPLSPQQEAAISLPASLFESIQYRDNIGIFFAFYEQSTLFPVNTNDDDSSAPSKVQVGSPVIASTVGGDNSSIENLSEPVTITLKTVKDSVISGTEECVSWDFDLQAWTPQGCNTSVGQDGVIVCTCNHLTNFAVLVDICLRQEVCGTSQVETVLTFISYVGMSASIISLIFALIILLSHRRIRQKTITKYHVQLSLSLLLMLIVSLVLVVLSAENITALFGGCVTVSVLVHYFTLVAVMWMGAEALFMFQKLVLVFVEITKKYIITVSAICWGLPIFFVLVPLLADLANGSAPWKDIVIKRTGFPSYCFLSNAGAFWGTFLIPILLILLFNAVIFIWISVVLIHHARCKASRKKEATNNKNFVQLMISISGVMFLFGITWFFAILTFSVTGLRETFQILFTVFNSFQGFFIFLFFCAINKEARESWKEMFGSGRQSLLHSPYANSYGHSPKGSHANAFRAQRSATDTSTVRHHDHIMTGSKFGDSRKESWDSDNSGYKPDALQDVKIVATEDTDIPLKGIMAENDEIKLNDKRADPIPVEREPKHDFIDNYSLTSATTESGIDPSDSTSIGEHDPVSKDGSPPLSHVTELDTAEDQTNSIGTNMERKDSATMKVSIKRYPSRIEREYDVEEMKVEFHSESSSESSDEDV